MGKSINGSNESGDLANRLSPMDALFVYVESDAAPMHIGVVGIYRGRVPLERYRRHLHERLHLIPRYRQRIVDAPLHLAHPAWEDDPDFDIRQHVHGVQMEGPGTEAQLRRLSEKIFSKRLSLAKPPWEQHLIWGLSGNRTAILTCLHHALADGLSSVAILQAMHDDVEGAPPWKPAPPRPQPASRGFKRFTEALADDLALPGKLLQGMREDVERVLPGLGAGHVMETLGEAAAVLWRYTSTSRQLPFDTTRLSGKKRFAWCDYPLEELKQAAHGYGGTVNDAVLTIVSGAVRRYLRIKAGDTDAPSLHISIPVNVRRPAHTNSLGNQISVQPVAIPLSIASTRERFAAIARQTRALKQAHVADGLHFFTQALLAVPAPLQYGLGKLYGHPAGATLMAGATSLATLNTICTNVSGPTYPMYTLGRECIAIHPMAPVIGGMGLLFPCVSYHGRLYLSAVADRSAVPDMQRLKQCMDRAHAELRP